MYLYNVCLCLADGNLVAERKWGGPVIDASIVEEGFQWSFLVPLIGGR